MDSDNNTGSKWYGTMQLARQPLLTDFIGLQGGQDRLRQLTLYVSREFATAARFGLVKLNKTLWKADFDAYANRRVPVTGRPTGGWLKAPLPKRCPAC